MKLYAPLVCRSDKSNISLPNVKVLDIGFGGIKISNAIGIDWRKVGGEEDVVHDLNNTPYPFSDKTFDLIVSTHCIEHLIDVSRTIDEICRVGKSRAHIVIQVPYFRSVNAFTDPTHKHFFATHSMDGLGNMKQLKMWLGSPVNNSLVKTLINKYPDFYDKYLSRLFPCECITWEFEII